MSDNDNFGFGKLVPGFDFLQNLARGASQAMPGMPALSSWIAPTLSVEEIEKRIGELRAVQFWLEQNGRALGATIQALEVQKMTLSTLNGMNVSMGELASALKVPAPAGAAAKPVPESPFAADAAAATAKTAARKAKAAETRGAKAETAGNGGAVDPLAWWTSLTQQFQQIAADAMKDVAGAQQAVASAATGNGKAESPAAAPARPKAAKATHKTPARKTRST